MKNEIIWNVQHISLFFKTNVLLIHRLYNKPANFKINEMFIFFFRNVHYSENIYKCNDKECPKVFRTQTSLKFHIEKVHENIGPKYCCHLCKKRFRRGNYLTAHLATVHDYKWPPGHKKFHYAMNENGLYHVQTMRFESFDLPNASYAPDEAT